MASKHTFDPFEELLHRVQANGVGSWQTIELDFLRVVEQFDEAYSRGGKTTGWYQAKARYFNDLVVSILQNLANKPISERCKKESQLFSKVDIDICFPERGTPMVAGEVKALGTPPHPGNKQVPRPASTDLHKRAREVAFTAMDLKASYAPPTKIGSFQQWVDSTSPGYFSFWAMRAKDEADLKRVKQTLTLLRRYGNGVGAVIYAPASGRSEVEYSLRNTRMLSIDQNLREMAQRIS